MKFKELDKKTQKSVLEAQANEITEHYIYAKMARKVKSQANREVLERISRDELKHYEWWQQYTGQEITPSQSKIKFYLWLTRTLGLNFGLKLMESGEKNAQKNYQQITGSMPELKQILDDEDRHEQELLDMLEERKLDYMGSVVLGLNDALVELTGALAGLTLALQNTRLIALTGLITGIAASLSMAASEYLATKSEETEKNAVLASIYTGIAYITTVILLILPYLLFDNYILDLALTLIIGVLIILVFNYYISVAKNLNFKRRFWEMALLSLGVAAISFGVGYIIRKVFGVEV